MKKILYTALIGAAMIWTPALAYTSGANPPTGQSMNSSTQTYNQGPGPSASQAVRAQNLDKNDVMEIQQALNSKGFLKGSADGVWGPQTASALKQFQKENQLKASGQPDQNTLNELGVDLSMNNSSQTAPDTPSSGNSSNAGDGASGSNGSGY